MSAESVESTTLSKLSKIQQQNLMQRLNEQKLADVTFVVGNGDNGINGDVTFQVNRFMMASISLVFEAMLYGNMKESKPNSHVLIEDVDDKSFECIIKHAYCNDPAVTHHTIIGVKYLCTKYQIDTLSNYVDEMFVSCLNENNFCFLLNGSIKIKCSKFVAFCKGYLGDLKTLETISNIINSDGFLKLTFDGMSTLLSWNCLVVNEEILWHKVSNWADYHCKCSDDQKENHWDSNHRLYLLKSIKKFIRFGHMKPSFFVDIVKPENIFTTPELISILSYLCSNKKDEIGCGDFCVERRDGAISMNWRRGTLALGTKLDIYDERYKEWYIGQVIEFGSNKCKGKVKIRYAGFSAYYDEYVDPYSKRLDILYTHFKKEKSQKKLPVKIV